MAEKLTTFPVRVDNTGTLQLLERRIDRLDRDAEEIEMHLHGASAKLIPKDRRQEMRASLAVIYADMAKTVEQIRGLNRRAALGDLSNG